MTEILIQHIEFAATHAHVWGFAIIFVLMAIESSFIPLPSEVVMIPAGFLAFRCGLTFQSPHLDAIMVILMGAFGSLAGAMFNYYLALWLGRPILYRYGKYFFLKPQFLERAEEIFRKYGDITTFVCRFLLVIRHLISIPAGLSRMDIKRFSFYTTLGAGIWCAILTYIGYYLGHIAGNMSYSEIIYKGKDLLAEHFIWILFGLGIVIVVYLYIHHKIMKSSKE